MNYIRHLSGFFIRLAGDERMTPYHISLYFALFQLWNEQRFGDRFVISRSEMMQLSRIGSANTYARCMKELSDWGYIIYSASSNLHSGSRVSCIRFDTESDTTRSTGTGTKSEITSDTGDHTANDTGIETDILCDTASDTGSDTGTSCDLKSDTGTDTSSESSVSGNNESDTGDHTANDTGIETDISCDTASDTGSDAGTSCDLKSDTGTDTASDTGITAKIKPDIGRNTAGKKNNPTRLKSVTGCDTGSDTLLINITNKNKQEENKETRGQKDDLDQKAKRQKQIREVKFENLSEVNFQVPDFPDVGQFFDQNQFPRSEAQKFYCHYQSAGWKTGNKMKILSWQAVARKWMINSKSLKNDEREPNQIRTGKLSVTVNKDYSEPL